MKRIFDFFMSAYPTHATSEAPKKMPMENPTPPALIAHIATFFDFQSLEATSQTNRY